MSRAASRRGCLVEPLQWTPGAALAREARPRTALSTSRPGPPSPPLCLTRQVRGGSPSHTDLLLPASSRSSDTRSRPARRAGVTNASEVAARPGRPRPESERCVTQLGSWPEGCSSSKPRAASARVRSSEWGMGSDGSSKRILESVRVPEEGLDPARAAGQRAHPRGALRRPCPHGGRARRHHRSFGSAARTWRSSQRPPPTTHHRDQGPRPPLPDVRAVQAAEPLCVALLIPTTAAGEDQSRSHAAASAVPDAVKPLVQGSPRWLVSEGCAARISISTSVPVRPVWASSVACVRASPRDSSRALRRACNTNPQRVGSPLTMPFPRTRAAPPTGHIRLSRAVESNGPVEGNPASQAVVGMSKLGQRLRLPAMPVAASLRRSLTDGREQGPVLRARPPTHVRDSVLDSPATEATQDDNVTVRGRRPPCRPGCPAARRPGRA